MTALAAFLLIAGFVSVACGFSMIRNQVAGTQEEEMGIERGVGLFLVLGGFALQFGIIWNLTGPLT